jgi:hypothetical protein
MSYKEFVEFHDENPDLDNTEYYEKFPDVNKSTIRSWKSRVNNPPPPIPTPSEADAKKFEGFEEQQKHYVHLLLTQTNSKASEFKGVDLDSQILVLRNRLNTQKEQKPDRGSNSSILPSPRPIGASTRKFGIDDYIVFDTNLNEIRMEIPLEKLMDPEENKRIREEVK